jgi:signal transduction histidine kinase
VVRLEAHADERMVSLEVADNGVGIPLADQARVFKEFERGTAPDARRMGAGLGLSLVKRIVELHGGTIDLVSVPGEGTTVTCRLPLWMPGERAVAADD